VKKEIVEDKIYQYWVWREIGKPTKKIRKKIITSTTIGQIPSSSHEEREWKVENHLISLKKNLNSRWGE